MIGRRCPQQVAVDPSASVDQVGERQGGPEAELKRGIAELDIQIDEAGLTAVLGFMIAKPDPQLGQQRRRTNPADALDDADHFGRTGRRRLTIARDRVTDWG